MIICGLKLTHDGAVALIDGNRLVFSYEMEKLNNNPRYSSLLDFFSVDLLQKILNENGYDLEDVDKFVLDGWGGAVKDGMQLDNDFPPFFAKIKDASDKEFEIELGGYGMLIQEEDDILKKASFSYPDYNFSYNSYLHVTGHVMGAYCTSPFAAKKEDSFVLVWDGGMFPQVFYVGANTMNIKNLGPIFHVLGNSYSVFATNYKPFNNFDQEDMSIAGKVMAYIALGKCNEKILNDFKAIFRKHEEEIQDASSIGIESLISKSTNLLKEFVICGELEAAEPANLMATLHVFFQDILLEKLEELVSRYPSLTKNLCSVGGCALNIKWNSNIRNSGLFNDIWVPPFPNDSGSAIGAACSEMVKSTEHLVLDWDVYKGPFLKQNLEHASWDSRPCSIQELAQILHEYDEPLIFLNGRAELGPRALGNRSILAAPVSTAMKSKLNAAKKREDYRPVAPICIEEDAPEIFLPGSPDPYMLFDHKVREDWINKIPAICHLDGTARLQTVSKEGNETVYTLLKEYKKLSGVPLLCNTSANHSGKGFFPDVRSVMDWGEVNIIWSEGKVYAKKGERFHRESELFREEVKMY